MKSYFPIFKNIPDLVYLDNAATTQKPQVVIDRIKYFYENENANIHRGIHFLGEIATDLYEKSRAKIASFINAKKPQEIIFTKNSTESLNLAANILSSILTPNDVVLLTEMEHHSNIIPWQILSTKIGFKIRYINLMPDFNLEISQKMNDKDYLDQTFENVKIFSFVHVSNSLGTINPVKELINIAKKYNVITVLDCAQSVGHMKLDMQDLDCDIAVFSAHKMYGPLGLGFLYGKYDLLNKLPPFLGGGDMISDVEKYCFSTAELPAKYEAGTPNVEGVIGLSAAIDFLSDIGWQKIHDIENEVFNYAFNKLKDIDFIEIFSPYENNVGIISFNIKNIHPHDVLEVLRDYKICIRSGHHCTQLVMKHYNLFATNRLSLAIYNTKDDIDRFIEALYKVFDRYKNFLN